MSTDGKMTDVLINENNYRDDLGIERFCNLTVWADEGNADIVSSTPGVTAVFNTCGPTQYSVYVDPRYDREWVKAEIEARIKIGGLQ
jgi:hypothetical protein